MCHDVLRRARVHKSANFLGLQPRGVRYLGLLFQLTEETPGALRLLQMANVS